jgi:hypothetical protein
MNPNETPVEKGLRLLKHPEVLVSSEGWRALVSNLLSEITRRDLCAASLMKVMEKLREDSGSEDPMAPFVHDASWEALAKEADAALARVYPTEALTQALTHE